MARKPTAIVSILVAVLLSFLLLSELHSARLRQGYAHLNWAESPRLPIALGNHQLLLYENYMYVVGGSLNDADPDHDEANSAVFRSLIEPGGRLENWTPVTSTGLPALKIAASDVSRTGRMYITGGHDGNSFSKKTYFDKETQPNEIKWQPSNFQFQTARGMHATVIVKEGLKDEIYVIGGLGSSPLEQTVLYSTLDPVSGELDAEWKPTESLLPQRFGHAAVTYKGWIYVIGGTIMNDEQPITKSVKYARASSGIQGEWENTEPLTEALSSLEAVVTDDGRIFVIGGRDRDSISRKVYVATINTQTGELSKWQEVAELELPNEAGAHSLASVYAPNGSIYVVGGQDNNLVKGVNNHYVDTTYHIPVLSVTKLSDPSDPVHEGDAITYTISYANTSLITQTITITDMLSFNLTLVPGSTVPRADPEEAHLVVWSLGPVPPGGSGQVSFQARVDLLPSPGTQEVVPTCPPPDQPDYVLPVPIACDTTLFWATGATHQPLGSGVYTTHVTIPPGSNPSAMWLAAQGSGDSPPSVEGEPAQLLKVKHDEFESSVFTSAIRADMIEDHELIIRTDSPRELNALFLFYENDPPFDVEALHNLSHTTETFTYALDIPSVETQTMQVLLPFMDLNYLTDDLRSNPYLTTVTVEFDGQRHQTVTNKPNLGNGLLMTQFPFTIGPLSDGVVTATKVLTVSVDTQDDIYTLGPRICRPVRIENTAWLCSLEAGCISDTVVNAPPLPMTSGIYLPLILKDHP